MGLRVYIPFVKNLVCISVLKDRVLDLSHYNIKQVEAKCGWCGKITKQPLSQITNYKHHFCPSLVEKLALRNIRF